MLQAAIKPCIMFSIAAYIRAHTKKETIETAQCSSFVWSRSPSFPFMPFRNLIILLWSLLSVSLVLCDHNDVNESPLSCSSKGITGKYSTVKFIKREKGNIWNSNRIAETLREMTMFLFVKIFSPTLCVLRSFQYPPWLRREEVYEFLKRDVQ